jgi:hypothetical protein
MASDTMASAYFHNEYVDYNFSNLPEILISEMMEVTTSIQDFWLLGTFH